MCFRKLTAITLLSALPFAGLAQPGYKEIDGQSYYLFTQGQWKALDSLGRSSIKSGLDFPLLRMRMGYASHQLGNYDRSYYMYRKALKEDPANNDVLEMQVLNNLYLGRTENAEYFMGKLDETARSRYARKPFELLSSADVEGGVMMPDDSKRETGMTTRIGLRSRINWRWSMYQSFGFFNQQAHGNPPLGAPANAEGPILTISQKDYFIRFRYQATASAGLMFGFHRYGFNVSTDRPPPPGQADPSGFRAGNIFVAGGSFVLPRTTMNLFVAYGAQDSVTFNQNTISLTYYPFGNTKFYLFLNEHLQTSNGGMRKFVTVPGIGFKPMKKLWVEGAYYMAENSGFNNLFENDGVYIENSFDNTSVRATLGLNYMLNDHLFIRMNGIYESKFYDFNGVKIDYNQPTITGGIVWKR